MKKLYCLLVFRSEPAKLTMATFGAPFLLLALFLFPSPMTEMKAEVYAIIIPIGMVGSLVAVLVECVHRRHVEERRRAKIWWPSCWWR